MINMVFQPELPTRDSEEPYFFYGQSASRHHRRIVALIDRNKVVVGGQFNEADRYIAPTVLKNVALNDKVMTEEIFGPVLPVMAFNHFDEIYDIISKLPQHPQSILKAATWFDLPMIYPPYKGKLAVIRRIMK
jgi:acyl-CoA reductase-like NAD-dependent aldehyde dehydrogenase